MEHDFTDPQTKANASTWLQSKATNKQTNKQTVSGGFLKVCVAIEGLEGGYD